MKLWFVKLHLIFSLSFLILSCNPGGGNGDAGDPVTAVACAGFVNIKVNFNNSIETDKVLILWNDEVLHNDCQPEIYNLKISKFNKVLDIGRGGPGFRASRIIHLKVVKILNCDASYEDLSNLNLLFQIDNIVLQETPPKLCQSFGFEFNQD